MLNLRWLPAIAPGAVPGFRSSNFWALDESLYNWREVFVKFSRLRAVLAFSVLVAGTACLTSPGCSSGPAEANVTGASSTAPLSPKQGKRQMAPDFALKDENGATVHLSDYKGKVVVLNFWATWCGPCQVEIPWFVQFEREYKDRGFAVVGVSLDDDGWSSVKPFIADQQINYRILLGNDSVSTLYGGVDSLPTTFLVDRSGRVASVHVGLVNKNTYKNEISHLLDGDQRASADAGAARAR